MGRESIPGIRQHAIPESEDIRWRPEIGKDGYQQPQRYVTRADEIPWRPISVTAGNPDDHGEVRRLIHPDINGSPDVEFFVGLYRMDAGEYHPRHFHPNGAEFYYVLDGEAEFLVNDEWVNGSPGAAFYFARETSHAIRVSAHAPLEIFYGFSPPDLQRVGIVWEE